MKLFLTCGDFSTGKTKHVDQQAINTVEKPVVLIIPWTNSDEEVRRKYSEFLKKYFTFLGAQKVLIINDDFKECFGQANFLYLPGGDTEIFIEEINRNKIGELIKNFEGTILGNSAGAYLVTKEYYKDGRVTPCLEMVDFNIKAHYTPKLDEELKKQSEETKVYAIPDGSALIIDDKISTVSDVFLFESGKKEKI